MPSIVANIIISLEYEEKLTMAAPMLFILYNADASVMGKLSYGYKKLTNRDKDNPTCAACDITHGGLSLDETSHWKAAKADLVDSGAVKEIKQLHRDELDPEVCPLVLASSGLRSYAESSSMYLRRSRISFNPEACTSPWF